MKRFIDMDLVGVDGQPVPQDIVAAYVDREEADRLAKALDEVPYKLHAAATIFRMIYRMSAGGFGPDEAELCAICELTADALDKPGDRDAFHIEQFASNLRTAIGCTNRRMENLESKGKE